jgi:hypothetical protein
MEPNTVLAYSMTKHDSPNKDQKFADIDSSITCLPDQDSQDGWGGAWLDPSGAHNFSLGSNAY